MVYQMRTVCHKRLYNATFIWNFQKYWVCLGIPKSCIVGYTLMYHKSLVAIIFFDIYFADITLYITAPDMFTVTSIVCNCMYHLYMASTTAHCITCIMVLITTFPAKYIIHVYSIQSMSGQWAKYLNFIIYWSTTE